MQINGWGFSCSNSALATSERFWPHCVSYISWEVLMNGFIGSVFDIAKFWIKPMCQIVVRLCIFLQSFAILTKQIRFLSDNLLQTLRKYRHFPISKTAIYMQRPCWISSKNNNCCYFKRAACNHTTPSFSIMQL